MSASVPKTEPSRKDEPAQPGKVLMAMLALTCAFYLIDCLLVTIFQDHPDTPWLEWGVHAKSPAGFGITVITFFVGIFAWLKEVARQADQERRGPPEQHPRTASDADEQADHSDLDKPQT